MCVSDAECQTCIWIRCEDSQIIDSNDDTTMYFTEDVDAVKHSYVR